jgi:hypothetical protein
MKPPVGNGALRSKQPMLSEAEKGRPENVPALRVFAVHPPVKLSMSL